MSKEEINPMDRNPYPTPDENGDFKTEEELTIWAQQQLNIMLKVDEFKAQGKENDPLYQTLVFLGHASAQLSYGNTVLGNYLELPARYREELSGIQSQIHDFKEKLRALDYCSNCNGVMLKGQVICASCMF